MIKLAAIYKWALEKKVAPAKKSRANKKVAPAKESRASKKNSRAREKKSRQPKKVAPEKKSRTSKEKSRQQKKSCVAGKKVCATCMMLYAHMYGTYKAPYKKQSSFRVYNEALECFGVCFIWEILLPLKSTIIYNFFIVVIFVFDDAYHGASNFSLWGLYPVVFKSVSREHRTVVLHAILPISIKLCQFKGKSLILITWSKFLQIHDFIGSMIWWRRPTKN